MSGESLAERLEAVERLTRLFRAERMVHLGVTSISLILLLTSAAFLIARGGSSVELSLMFGSSGLITYSASRLLHMWDQALSLVANPPSAGDS